MRLKIDLASDMQLAKSFYRQHKTPKKAHTLWAFLGFSALLLVAKLALRVWPVQSSFSVASDRAAAAQTYSQS